MVPKQRNSIHTKSGRRRKWLTHEEIMEKRHKKKNKNRIKSNSERKKELIQEYQRINKVEFSSKKNSAKVIMEIVEEVKDKGMNDKRYLDIMDNLMGLFKEGEEEEEQLQPIRRNRMDTRIWNTYSNILTERGRYSQNIQNEIIDLENESGDLERAIQNSQRDLENAQRDLVNSRRDLENENVNSPRPGQLSFGNIFTSY